MRLIYTEDFQHEGELYQLIVYQEGTPPACRYDVLAFKDSERANGFIYSVNFSVHESLYGLWGEDAVKDLIRTAKEDIKDNRWENLKVRIEAISENGMQNGDE